MISIHLFLLLFLPATLGVELPYMRCFLLPPSKYMIFVVDVWFPLYFPSLKWKRAIFEVFARGIFYSLLCMFQYQASRQPWWTVSFWFRSRPSGWFLQTWDVLNIWYDNFIYDNYYFFCKISREKNRCFLPLICFLHNLQGFGVNVQFTDMQAHSLKPSGGTDMQFNMTNNQVRGARSFCHIYMFKVVSYSSPYSLSQLFYPNLHCRNFWEMISPTHKQGINSEITKVESRQCKGFQRLLFINELSC